MLPELLWQVLFADIAVPGTFDVPRKGNIDLFSDKNSKSNSEILEL